MVALIDGEIGGGISEGSVERCSKGIGEGTDEKVSDESNVVSNESEA